MTQEHNNEHHKAKRKKNLGSTLFTALTVGGILWEERGLIRRIFKEAGKQINKIKNQKD